VYGIVDKKSSSTSLYHKKEFHDYKLEKIISGKELIGLTYSAPFDDLSIVKTSSKRFLDDNPIIGRPSEDKLQPLFNSSLLILSAVSKPGEKIKL
jgi:hypothetical protein